MCYSFPECIDLLSIVIVLTIILFAIENICSLQIETHWAAYM